jgi:hypothetical protein
MQVWEVGFDELVGRWVDFQGEKKKKVCGYGRWGLMNWWVDGWVDFQGGERNLFKCI